MRFSVSLGFLAAALVPRAAPVTNSELKQKVADGLRLISFSEDDLQWKTEDEKIELLKEKKQFFDVTDVYQEGEDVVSAERAPAVSYSPPSHQTQVNALIKTIDLNNMKSYLTDLTAFNNRYYKAATGEQATQWIISTVQDIIDTYPSSNASVSRFANSFTQGSIIAKIPGTNSSSTGITILGAHMDSINLNNPTSGRAPGADDDGSGTVNLLEAFRALLASGFKPASPVEFHWYAGEEGGLLGSQAIAASYKNAGKSVKAMLQFDMTAYFKPGTKETISLMPDYVDQGLTTFVGQLIDAYSLLPHDTSPKCGYACSDHASWYNKGYPTALPFETRFGEDNPNIHTSGDTTAVNGFSWTHTLEYVKVAVGFAYELGI